MRKLLVVLGVVLLVLVIADIGLKSYAEGQVGREIQSSLELAQEPSVSLGGFPFLPKLATGSFPAVTVEVEGYEAAGLVRVDRIEVELRDVHIPRSQLLSTGQGAIRAERGDGSIRITGTDATAALNQQGFPLTIRFRRGQIAASLERVTGEATADLRLEGQSLVITPEFPIRVDYALLLPPVVPGIAYSDLRVEGGVLVVEFDLEDVVIEVE